MNKAVFEGNAQSCDIMNDIIKKDMKQIKIDIPKGYEFFGISDDNEIVLTKKQLQLPKTFIEVLNFWHPDRQLEDDYQRCYKKDLIEKFQDLLYARDAYWKIAGEQMGLGKPWEPDWTTFEAMPAIFRFRYNIVCDFIKGYHCLLVFPTTEMRDDFYENFKDLVEQCKELL